ncbi:MAG: hypothetical protein ABII79_03725 [bacterium]
MATRKKTRRAIPRRKFASRNVRPWNREEIAFMRKYYRKFETAWIARQLGRTVYSVRYKAVDLSIKKASPSIWRGNVGANNAFRPTKSRTVAQKTTRKATTTRTTRTRSWKASAPKRNNRTKITRRNNSRPRR